MLQSLGASLNRELKAEFNKAGQPDAQAEAGWVLMDYGDVVVHLFSPEQREFYGLEELWSEGQVVLRLM